MSEDESIGTSLMNASVPATEMEAYMKRENVMHQDGFNMGALDDLKRTPSNDKFKTKLCKKWSMNQNCSYGDRCMFSHGEHDIRRPTQHMGNRAEDEYMQRMLNQELSMGMYQQMMDPLSMALLASQMQQQQQPTWWVPVTSAGTTCF